MLVRDADGGGIEVFMVRRAVAAAFAAGMYVFPGGRVDDADGGHGGRRLRRRPRRRRGVGDARTPSGGLAYWVAAIRECFEEAGLLLARSIGRRTVRRRPTATDRAVHRGELSMIELCRRHDVVLDAGALRYVVPLGHAGRRVAAPLRHPLLPRRRPRRPGRPPRRRRDSSTAAGSSRPTRLAAAERGELVLMPPTIANLRFIAGCATVAEALARADAAGPPPRIEPRIRRGPNGKIIGVALPGDPDYDELA